MYSSIPLLRMARESSPYTGSMVRKSLEHIGRRQYKDHAIGHHKLCMYAAYSPAYYSHINILYMEILYICRLTGTGTVKVNT